VPTKGRIRHSCSVKRYLPLRPGAIRISPTLLSTVAVSRVLPVTCQVRRLIISLSGSGFGLWPQGGR
jgi:hypothetical protein